MDEFEFFKHRFSRVRRDPVHLRLKMKANHLDPRYYNLHHVVLSSGDLQSLFDPVVSRIIHLIDTQLKAADKECGYSVINVSVVYDSPMGKGSDQIGIVEDSCCGRIRCLAVPPGGTSMLSSTRQAISDYTKGPVRLPILPTCNYYKFNANDNTDNWPLRRGLLCMVFMDMLR